MPNRRQSTIGDAEAMAAASRAKDTTHHYGQYLHGFAWTHFVSLSSVSRVATDVALSSHFETVFIPRLEQLSGGVVHWTWAAERSPGTGVPHLHALLALSWPCRRVDIAKAWGIGNCDIQFYDRNRGASFYLAKYTMGGNLEFDISATLPEPVSASASAF